MMIQSPSVTAPPSLDGRAERRIPMSYEAWRAWPEAEGRQTEWVDGEVIVFVPSSIEHADLVLFLGSLLDQFVRMIGTGKVVLAPFEVRLTPRISREPDILYLVDEARAHGPEKRIEGPVDLAVELISDDSVGRDRRLKFQEYADAGIPEYWVLDPRPGHRRAEFFGLGAEGYEPLPADETGRLHSRVLPGFWLRPAWLRQEPPPNPLACLLEIAPDALATLLPAATGEPPAGGQDH